MTSVALIACDNGLGHLRRAGLLARALADRGARVALFGPVERLASFRAWPALSEFADIELHPFHTRTSAEALRRGDALATRWHERLPDLDGFDLVVSDNLPEILLRRPDAVLSGHFLWHDALSGVNAEYRRSALELMRRYRPPVIATALFAAPTLAEQGSVVPVGLFRAAPRVDAAERTDLLVSAGTGCAEFDFLANLVARLAGGEQPPFERVFLEPRLMPRTTPAWLMPAPYTPGMYAGTLAAICRPGIGTLTDCLLSGVRVFAISEPDNEEMRTNIERLRAAGVGEGFKTAAEAFDAALRFRSDVESQRRHQESLRALPDDGARAATSWLLSRYVGRNAGANSESRVPAR